MWTAPSPAWNQTSEGNNAADIQTAVIQVVNGTTNVPVRWGYTLLDGQSIKQFVFRIDGDDIGNVIGGERMVFNRYSTRFSVDSNSEFCTLIINKVTERENATFQSELRLADGTQWAYNIRIEVTGIYFQQS